MSKRRRSSFKRRGGKPFGQAERDRETVDFTTHLVASAEMEARMRTMESVLLPATSAVLARIEVVGELLAELRASIPREVDVTVVGMSDSPVQLRAEVLEGSPIGTTVLVMPSSVRR